MTDFRSLTGRHNFYFLRHGESMGNDAGVLQGRRDYPLSPRGQQQALQAALWFADKGIARILSSPLLRGRQTADLIASALGVPQVEEHPGLSELDIGIFTGLTVEQASRQHPAAWRRFQLRSWEAVPRAERVRSLARRAEGLWLRLEQLARDGAGDLLCVTHSGILQWLVKVTFGQRCWMPLVPMSNCAISLFSVDNRSLPQGADRPAGAERTESPGRPLRHYCEWSLLNYRPAAETSPADGPVVGHVFLRP